MRIKVRDQQSAMDEVYKWKPLSYKVTFDGKDWYVDLYQAQDIVDSLIAVSNAVENIAQKLNILEGRVNDLVALDGNEDEQRASEQG